MIFGLLAAILLLAGGLWLRECLTCDMNELASAVRSSDMGKISRCIDQGATLNRFTRVGWYGRSRGSTPLVIAVENSTPEIVAYLIREGADVNLRPNQATTTACKAAIRGDLEIIEILFQAGADFSEKGGGLTPLEWAEAAKRDRAITAIQRILR